MPKWYYNEQFVPKQLNILVSIHSLYFIFCLYIKIATVSLLILYEILSNKLLKINSSINNVSI